MRDVTEEYVLDPDMQEFFRESNPWALRSIVERLLEAVERGLWENPPPEMLEKLRDLYLELEADLEARQEGRPGSIIGPAQVAGGAKLLCWESNP